MANETNPAAAYVTKAELAAVEVQVAAVVRTVDRLAETVEADRDALERRDREIRDAVERGIYETREEIRRERESRRPPLGAIVAAGIGLFALVLTICGMAAGLIVFAISGAVAPVQRDVTENIEELSLQWELTFPRLRWEGEIAEKIAALERFDETASEYMDRRRGIEDRVDRVERDIADLENWLGWQGREP